jgi:hypothetical protein
MKRARRAYCISNWNQRVAIENAVSLPLTAFVSALALSFSHHGQRQQHVISFLRDGCDRFLAFETGAQFFRRK